MKIFWKLITLLLFFVIACSSGCSRFVEATTELKIDQARQDGKRTLEKTPVVKNPKVVDYVNKLGKKLANQPIDQQRFNVPLNFYVMNINTTAGKRYSSFTIGGYIFLERRELELAKSEGEIAGILSHEIAHNYLGHTINDAGYDWCIELSESCYDLHYKATREQESTADLLAVKIMTKAGYDPEDFAANFLRTAKEMTARLQISYPSHPSMYERVRNIRTLAKTLQVAKKPPKNTPELKQAQKLLKKEVGYDLK